MARPVKISSGGKVNYDHDEWVIASEEDLKLLSNLSLGDIALNANNGEVFIFNGREWVKL